MKKIKLYLHFPPEKIDQPITYHLVRDFELIFNILHAEIHPNKNGELTVELEGTEENLNKGLDFLKSHGVGYKLFNKNIIWNEDKCVHCGACTAVCPSRALTLEKDTWTLTFDHSKCLMCELCIRACPINAMDVDLFL